MRRIQFLEIHDQPWFTSTLRDEVTDALQFGLNLLKGYSPIVPLLQHALDSAHSSSIVDLCSGAGGPWLDLSQRLQQDSQNSIEIVLTDKYPNLTAFQNVATSSANRVSFYSGSVDARKVPQDLNGFRTLFTSFHHFAPDESCAILQNAVDAKQGIGIFEITKCSVPMVALMFPWILLLFVCTPFIRPFRWSRLFWTFLIPVLPFVLLFDGIVSCLRTYRPEELRALVEKLGVNDYHWDIGEFRGATGKMPISYLIGIPLPHAETAGNKTV
jgi:hypothetical protein